MNAASIAAVVFCTLTALVIGFQLALAWGAPWGAYAMGGKFPGRFPTAMRVAAVVQALVLGLLAAVILVRAGLLLPHWASTSAWASWVVVAVSAISFVLNSSTPSKGERRIWAPVALLMLASSLTVALAS